MVDSTSHRRNADFYPRPPRGGRLPLLRRQTQPAYISIHALREEGDVLRGYSSRPSSYFYPRPPRGGRLPAASGTAYPRKFLSTPSARRATVEVISKDVVHLFLSTPSARRATAVWLPSTISSIFLSTPSARRATRYSARSFCSSVFLSTPSARRATEFATLVPYCPKISIHALREEGDRSWTTSACLSVYFYPRPPRGGRPFATRRRTTA